MQQTVLLTPVGTVNGQVTNPDGSPASGEYVNLSDANGIFSAYAATDSAGNYAAFPVPADRLIKVFSYQQTNTSNKTVEAVANNQKVPGDAQTLTVNLRYPGFLNIHLAVVNADGSPYTTNYTAADLNSADGLQRYSSGLAADGTVTFSGVVEATFVAYAYSEFGGLPLGSKTFTVQPNQDGTTVNVTIPIAPSGTVQGTVFASDGATPINSGYSVTVTDIDTNVVNYINTTGSTYLYSPLQNGASGFKLTAEFGNNTSTIETATGSITTNGQVITQNFTLPVSSISGQVFLYDGVTPVSNANIYASQVINSYTTNVFYTTSDANGNYQVSGPVTGAVNIHAEDSNGVVGTASVNLATDTAIVTGAQVSLGPVGMVMGIAYDENGNLLTNTEVDLQSSGNNNGFYSSVNTDDNGNFQFTDVPIGNITLTAYAPDNTEVHGTGTLTTAGSTINIIVGTAPIPPPPTTGEIFGTVYDQDGNPNPGATVTGTAASPSTVVVTATTDVNGMYTAFGFPVGDVTVTAVLSDGSTTTDPVTGTVTDVTVPVEIDLGLGNPGDVSGFVADVNGDPIPNVNIELDTSADPNTGYVESTGGDGSYDFGGIDAGTITIYVYDSNGNTIGTATGNLPYGGDLVLNVNTNTVGANFVKAQVRLNRRTPAVATLAPIRTPRTVPLPLPFQAQGVQQ